MKGKDERRAVCGSESLSHWTVLVLLSLSILSSSHSPAVGPRLLTSNPPLQSPYEGTGIPAPVFWTGDGNRINNTSFETGNYQPWVPVQSYALTTTAQIASMGYDGSSSLRLTLVSGNFTNNNFWEPGEPVLYDNSTTNGVYDPGEVIVKGPAPPIGSTLQNDPFMKYNDTNINNSWNPGETVILDADGDQLYSTVNDIVITGTPPSPGTFLRQDPRLSFVDQNSDSYYSALYDVGGAQVGFETSLRLRAAIFLESLTGSTLADRAEATITITTSLGSVLTVHYFVSPNPDTPPNTSSDAYYRVSSQVGQWVSIDRNVPIDVQQSFSSVFSSVNSVKEVRLSVFGRTQPVPTDDPKLRYSDSSLNGFWELGESLVYDANGNSRYDTGEQVISGTTPTIGTSLKDDPKIKFVDSNNNSVWDTGESIIYDKNSNGQWDPYVNGEMVISGSTPSRGTLLQKPAHETTRSLFDRVELYSATGNYDWVKNGAFTNGLSGWTTGGFTTSPSIFPPSQTPPSASGTATNGAAELVQSIDARPRVEPWTKLKADVRVGPMTGSSRNDTVDILLGLVDNRGYAFSLYYVFRTGDSNLPVNSTDSLYVRPNGFGQLDQWISINRNLTQDTRDFSSLLGFTPPFRIELLALEVAAAGPSSSTTAYFDDISVYQPYKYGQATSHFYATPGSNSTYLYTAVAIPQGSFYVDIPRGQTVLNVTSPEGSRLGADTYSVQVDPLAEIRRITIPGTTMFAHAPQGDWEVFTTSTNSLSKLYVEDPVRRTENSTLKIGSTANLVSRTIDPLSRPVSGAAVNITLWDEATGSSVLTRTGLSDVRGWFNVTGLTPSPGTYLLVATSFSPYVGASSFPLSIKYTVTLSMTVSVSQVSAGTPVTISGSVSPPTAGIVVTIFYRPAGATQPTQLTTVTTDGNGRYSYNWSPPQGDYEITATVGDSATNSAGSSPSVLLVGPAQNQLLLLLAIAGVIAAAVILTLVLFSRRSRGLQPPSTPA